MAGRSLQELSNELNRLMLEHMESVKDETFVGLSEESLHRREDLLKRIREVSADFLAALKRNLQ